MLQSLYQYKAKTLTSGPQWGPVNTSSKGQKYESLKIKQDFSNNYCPRTQLLHFIRFILITLVKNCLCRSANSLHCLLHLVIPDFNPHQALLCLEQCSVCVGLKLASSLFSLLVRLNSSFLVW